MSVLVYTENWDGKFKKLSFELVSYASAVAAMAKTNVTALSIGNAEEAELKKLGDFGADRILSFPGDQYKTLDNQVFTAAVAAVARKENSNIIIFSNNNTGKALAPGVSVMLKAGLASGVSGLPLSLDPFTVSKRAYSGNAFAHVVIKSDVTKDGIVFAFIKTENGLDS
ncbi:MAG: hypothetical protein ABSA76_15305 [Bacteroidales bacterium]